MDLYKIDFLIGWGNLLLEESVFKEAKKKKVKPKVAPKPKPNPLKFP